MTGAIAIPPEAGMPVREDGKDGGGGGDEGDGGVGEDTDNSPNWFSMSFCKASKAAVASFPVAGPMKLYKIGQPWQNEHFYCQ
jgi:hypothetical protein